jgi:ribosome-associated protein
MNILLPIPSREAVSVLPAGAAPIGSDALSLVQAVLSSLDDSKAEDVVSIDLHGKTSIADSMIIATGRSNVHVAAIADRIIKVFKADAAQAPRVEGLPHGDWVLIDAGDIIVHVFRPEVRQFYNLEKMWGMDRPMDRSGERLAG